MIQVFGSEQWERKDANNIQRKWGKVTFVLSGLTVPIRAELSLGAGCLGG